MSPREKKPIKQAEPAEFPDDTEISGVANYDLDDMFHVEDKDPTMRYYFAAPGDKFRADGVERLKARGYRLSQKEHHHPECILMEIPMDLYRKREAAVLARQQKNQREMMEPPEGLEVLPGHRHGVR